MKEETRAHERLASLLKSAFIFCILFVSADILTAVFFFPPVPPSIRRAHLIYHHGFAERATETDSWFGRNVDIATNSLELRDVNERTVPLRSTKHRVLFLGDSMVEGQGVSASEVFPEVFAHIAEENGIPLESLNGGVASHSATLYYYHLLYLLELKGVKIDEVFIFFDISDPQDDIFYRHFVPGDHCFLISRRIESYLSRYSAVFRTFFSHSARNGLAAALKPVCLVMDQAWPDPLRRYVPTSENKKFGELMASVDARFSMVRGLNPWEAEVWPKGFMEERFRWVYDEEMKQRWASQGLQLSRFYLERVAEYLRSKRIPLTIVVYPNPYHLRGGKPASYVSYWSEFARDEQVGFISMFDIKPFDDKDVEKTIKTLFIEGDVHWNEAGHQKVASELFNQWKARAKQP